MKAKLKDDMRGYNANEIIKICDGLETTEEEAFSWYEHGLYIVKYQGVYQLHYSQAQKHTYGHLIIQRKGLTRRGHFYVMSAKSVNRFILGEKVLNEDNVKVLEQ